MKNMIKRLSIWFFRKAFNLNDNRKEAKYARKK